MNSKDYPIPKRQTSHRPATPLSPCCTEALVLPCHWRDASSKLLLGAEEERAKENRRGARNSAHASFLRAAAKVWSNICVWQRRLHSERLPGRKRRLIKRTQFSWRLPPSFRSPVIVPCRAVRFQRPPGRQAAIIQHGRPQTLGRRDPARVIGAGETRRRCFRWKR